MAAKKSMLQIRASSTSSNPSGSSVAGRATSTIHRILRRVGRLVTPKPINPTASANPQPRAEKRCRSASVTTNRGRSPRLRNVSTSPVFTAFSSGSILRLRTPLSSRFSGAIGCSVSRDCLLNSSANLTASGVRVGSSAAGCGRDIVCELGRSTSAPNGSASLSPSSSSSPSLVGCMPAMPPPMPPNMPPPMPPPIRRLCRWPGFGLGFTGGGPSPFCVAATLRMVANNSAISS